MNGINEWPSPTPTTHRQQVHEKRHDGFRRRINILEKKESNQNGLLLSKWKISVESSRVDKERKQIKQDKEMNLGDDKGTKDVIVSPMTEFIWEMDINRERERRET